MARSLITFCIAAALLSAGCIPVSEPVGDIDKAEPNKELLGEWIFEETGDTWVIDRLEVKGNPKGLMRIRVIEKGKKLENVGQRETLWFFSTTLGKHTYVNLLIGKKEGDGPHLAKEGEYAEWVKRKEGGYYVGWLVSNGDTLTLDKGDHKAVKKLMDAEKIARNEYYYLPEPGWLTAYLEKNGPEAIFTGSDVMKFTRVKKK